MFKWIFSIIFKLEENIHEIKELFTPDGGIISYLKANTNILEKYPELEKPNDYVFRC